MNTADDLLKRAQQWLWDLDVDEELREEIRAYIDAPKDEWRWNRGDTVICLETNEQCLVWTSSIKGDAWVRFPDGTMGSYTAEQMDQLFSHPPKTAPTKPMTEDEMRVLFRSTNTAEPLCEGWPGLERFARAIERHHGIGGGDE